MRSVVGIYDHLSLCIACRVLSVVQWNICEQIYELAC